MLQRVFWDSETLFCKEISRDANNTCKRPASGAVDCKDWTWAQAGFGAQKKAPQMRGLDYLERVMRIELTTLTLAT